MEGVKLTVRRTFQGKSLHFGVCCGGGILHNLFSMVCGFVLMDISRQRTEFVAFLIKILRLDVLS